MEIIMLAILILVAIEVSVLVFIITKRTPNVGRRKVYIDTSALMDGRIMTAAQTGFIPDKLIVPASVVAELQLLADQSDSEKRVRARRGLDVITELQAIKGISVTILNDGPVGEGGVDARLVELAKKDKRSMLCTIDFNLNKVATVNGIFVLNVNELAGNIRMAFLPGEKINLPLTQKGQSDNQAVGYLADGTMVVVDKAGKEVGKTVQIEFIRSLQTAAGRMMFARLVAQPHAEYTRGASKGRSRMLEKEKIISADDKNKPPVKQKSPKKARKKHPTDSNSEQDLSEKASNKQSVRKTKRSSSSSREDSLIELVNNQ